MKKLILILLLLAVAGSVYGYFRWYRPEAQREYRFVEVERGDIESTVDATGRLAAVSTVAVGTQISGRIDAIFADFNDRVKAGQLVARIDPTLLEQSVREAEAAVARRQAEVDRLERDLERSQTLLGRELLSESAFETVKYNTAAARADLASAKAGLDRARQNLAYSKIYSPIDGVVIERNVDVGQTVAASLSAPQLFLIAEDLSKMEILATVDESDIGKIHDGQSLRFTVQAYPDDNFRGVVRQVRLQSTVAENVVNYTAVITVDNDDGRLLPGMTATVDFLIDSANDVLKVPNSALRFRPTEEMLAELRAQRAASQESSERASSSGGQPREGGSRPNVARLWTVDEAGRLSVVPVRTGLSDGISTAIEPLGDRELEEGLQVIAGVSQAAATASSSPLRGTPQSSGRRRPGGF